MDHGLFQVPGFKTAAAVVSCVLVSTEPLFCLCTCQRMAWSSFKSLFWFPFMLLLNVEQCLVLVLGAMV